jgi:ABC-type uncharacterized transport system involved in gliding motility auxiliary subunit
MSQKGKLFFILSILSFLTLGGLFFAIRVWMPFMWIVFATSLLCLGGGLFYDYKVLVDFFSMKTTKLGMNMGLILLLTVLFLTVINYLGAKHYMTLDFSYNQVNSISEQSKKVIGSLEGDLIVKFFYKEGAERVEENKKLFRQLVKQYEDISNKVKFEFVEINERPRLALDYGANKGSGEAFIDYKGSKNRIENYSEQDFTNAIIKVTRKHKKIIYFLEGHGERSLDDEKSETSLFGFKQLLEKNSYTVKSINLASSLTIPNDATALVIAGPTQQLQISEIISIEDYLNNGHSLLVLLDEKDTYGLNPLLKKMGLELDPNYVYNIFDSPMGSVVNAQAATVAVEYSPNDEITKVFTNNQMTVFRNPHSINVLNTSNRIKTEVLVKTPKNSVALKELDSKDYTGEPRSFNIAVSSRGKLTSNSADYSAVVIADADFVSNILLYQNMNRDLALNAISSLTKETDLISISAKEPLATKMLVSPPEFLQFFNFSVVGLFIPLPFVLMILSIVLWYRRRHA